MQCPFCAEEIKDAALVCRYCGRDLAIPKPLIEENRRLRDEVAGLRASVAALQAGASVAASPLPEPSMPVGSPPWRRLALIYGVVPVVLLLLAHFLVVMRLDMSEIYLRLVSIAVPVPFGYMLLWRDRQGLGVAVAVGAAIGVAAVAGMLVVVGIIDRVAIVPEDAREWRETFEYALSIALALVTGNVLAQIVRRTVSRGAPGGRLSTAVAKSVASVAGDKGPLHQRIGSVEQLLNSGLAIATALGAIYAGVKGVLP